MSITAEKCEDVDLKTQMTSIIGQMLAIYKQAMVTLVIIMLVNIQVDSTVLQEMQKIRK